MGITDIFRRFSQPQNELSEASKDVSENYKVTEFTAEDCEGCTGCYPSSLNIEGGDLYNSAPKVYGQVLVATGRSNWVKNIGDEPTSWGRVCQKLSDSAEDLSKLTGGPIRINGTDLEYDEIDEAGKVAVILLPQFIRIATTPETCVEDVSEVFKLAPGDKPKDNMTVLPERGFIMLCSHRTRDKRCGITAPIMRKSLEIELRHEDLFRDFDDNEKGGIRVVYCNHVGGHKFAANVLIYQNNGMALMLARIRPEHAKAIVQKTILKNEVVPEYVRFCNKLQAFEW